MKPELEGVPASSELVITASKSGYRPTVYAVTTGNFDQDVTSNIGPQEDNGFFGLTQPDAVWFSESFPELGALFVFATACSRVDGGPSECGFLGGVEVVLEPSVGVGPVYVHGGKQVPEATRTVPGDFGSPETSSNASFANLPSGEYTVTLRHPDAFCSVAGRASDPVYGYAREGSTIRAPVLDRHLTLIGASCVCRDSSDRKSCAPR